MICSPCRKAGVIHRTDPERARKLHRKCPGGTRCDCGHVILPEESDPPVDRVDC
jgi:hypothetical protein